MQRKVLVIASLVLLLALAGWVSSALAITWGEPDTDNQFANVGAFMVELDDGRVLPLCTGTLVHEQIFLTAAHCTAYAEEILGTGRAVDIFVTFDVDVRMEADPNLLDVSEMITHPLFDDFATASNPHDAGILVLADAVDGIEPAILPTVGLLDELKKDGALRTKSQGAPLIVAGYGGVLDWPPPSITYEDQRRYAVSEYRALVPAQLHMDQNRLHDNGGTCFGDSGGPAFWQDEDNNLVLVGITSWGDAQCVVTGFDYRVDIPDTLDLIQEAVDGL